MSLHVSMRAHVSRMLQHTSSCRALLAELTGMRAADPTGKVSEGHYGSQTLKTGAADTQVSTRWSSM